MTGAAKAVRLAALLQLALLLGAVLAPSAGAQRETPAYSLSIVEGETTLPEQSILSTSGSVSPSATATLRIYHEGVIVAQDSGEGWVSLSQAPRVGDPVTLESPSGSGQIVGSVVYDGLPTMDPTVCAGSTDFSGQRSANTEVEGDYYTLVAHPNYTAQRRGGAAQITSLVGSSFGGDFLRPLAIGETVSALERARTSLAGGAVFTYSSETVRPVGACPSPPPPPSPPPLPPALQGSILSLGKVTIHKLLRAGWMTKVTINQPGTVTADLYQQNGVLPAVASSAGRTGRHHKRRRPPALLLARGAATAKSAGTVDVLIRVTARGRRALERAHHVKAVLIVTLRSASGAKLTLGRRSVSLRA